CDGEYGWDGWLGAYFCNCPKEDLTFLFMMQKTDAGTTPLTRKLRNITLSSCCE
ncbi:MAG: serine hydrolase, partial [Bacillota bacterium]|nr:serine hydrolase [Bacillota bacterium]